MNTKPPNLVKHKISLRLPKYMLDFLAFQQQTKGTKPGHVIENALTTTYNLLTTTETQTNELKQYRRPLEPRQ